MSDKIQIVQSKNRPVKSHKGEVYTYRKMRQDIPMQDKFWEELTEFQQESILHGDGCGHPSNRPKSIAEASRWVFTVRLDTGEIHGFNPGWSFAF